MIPVNEPLLTELEQRYVAECVRTGWVSSSGKFIQEFEERWAAYCGRRYGVAVTNGTAALELSIDCLDLGPGDEVIIPTFTIISCAQAVVTRGATPVLVDCDRDTWTMDPNQVESKITKRTKAIMPVHIYGHPVDMDPLLELSERHGITIVEDAAEAHGAEYRTERDGAPHWRRCGSFGAVSCFSFYANKLVTTGEGGMLVTDDPSLAERARGGRNLWFQAGRRFLHERLGYNFRLTNMQAALGVAQVERIDDIVARKRWQGREYTSRLEGTAGLTLAIEKPWARSVYWMYGVVLSEDTGLSAMTFAERLRERGVETRPFFVGMHEQPVFRRRGLFAGERYPVAELISQQGLYLPSGVALTEAQLATVCDAVREALD